MINMHPKYDSVHRNEMFYAFICINNYVIISASFMLSNSLMVIYLLSIRLIHVMIMYVILILETLKTCYEWMIVF